MLSFCGAWRRGLPEPMSEVSLHGEVQLAADGVLRLCQITDSHLMASPGGTLLNVDTDKSLAAVVDLALETMPDMDAILVTGDIAGDGAASAYQRFEQAIGVLPAPSFWLPGNHDQSAQPDISGSHFCRAITTPHWHILLLNSQVDNEVGGRLAAAELDALSAAVDAVSLTGRHLLVALHHPLLPVGCAWLDEQRVSNAEAAFAEIARCRTRVVVISGHVHQAFDRQVDGIRYLTTPSTCIQFAPGQQDFAAEDIGPGYRWLELHPDGQIQTDVERVVDQSFPVDLQSSGYL